MSTLTAPRLTLHCGSHRVTRTDLDGLTVPPPLGPHHRPIHPGEALAIYTDCITQSGFTVTGEDIALRRRTSSDQQREDYDLFAIMGVTHPTVPNQPDLDLVVGFRTTTDQSIACLGGIGTRVFICDNLAFSATHQFRTKSTTHVMRRLQPLMFEQIANYAEQMMAQLDFINTLKSTPMSQPLFDHLVLSSMRAGVLPSSKVAAVFDAARRPIPIDTDLNTVPYIDAFENHTEDELCLWQGFNCITEITKTYANVDQRTSRLNLITRNLLTSNA